MSDFSERNSHIRQLRAAGNSLQDIANIYGVSRERIRQIVSDGPGKGSGKKAAPIDPISALHTLRTRNTIMSVRAWAAEDGASVPVLSRLSHELGLVTALTRLFRARRSYRHMRIQEENVRWAQQFFAEHGRSPTQKECLVSGVYFGRDRHWKNLNTDRRWKNLNTLLRRAALPTRGRGGRVHLHRKGST